MAGIHGRLFVLRSRKSFAELDLEIVGFNFNRLIASFVAMVFNTRRRAAAKEVEKLWLPKFASRLVCIFFAIVAIGLAGATFKWDSGVIWLVVPLGLSIIWNTANVIVRSVRARPIHPGANVGCDLVIWIIFTVAISLSFIAATVTTNYYPYSYDNYAPVKGHNGSVSYNPTKCNGFDTCKELDDFVGFVHRIGKLQIAAGVFSTICL